MCVSTRGIKFVHCHNVKYCSRKTNDRVKIPVVTNVCNKSKARVLFGNLLFFSFHLPWALSRCSRPGLTALAYYNNRSKQLAFAELRHLTLELIICNIVQIFMKTWQGNFPSTFLRSGLLNWRVSYGVGTPSWKSRRGFPSDYHFVVI